MGLDDVLLSCVTAIVYGNLEELRGTAAFVRATGILK